MNRLSEWFTEIGLLLNFKAGMTESLIFCTNQRLAKIPKNVDGTNNHQEINVTTCITILE